MDAKPHIPQTTILPQSWRGEMRALLTLGIPMALTQLISFSVSFVDMVMIGRLSPVDIAAAGVGSVIFYFLWMLTSGPIMAVSPLVSQALGADQSDRVDPRRSVRMTLWMIILLTPLMLLLVFNTERVAIFLGQDPSVSAKAQSYILAMMIGLPFLLAGGVLRNFLAALDKTFVPFLIITATTFLNIGLNFVLIFGLYGLPKMGLTGAGLASAISGIVGFILLVGYVYLDPRARSFHIFENFFRTDWERFGEVFRLGWPMSMATTFEGMLFNAAVLIVGVIGVTQQAAYQIALNVAAMAFMMPWGMSMAGAVRIGLARGAGNKPAERRAASTTMIACIIMIGLIAIPVAIWPNGIASIYLNLDKPENQAVIAFVVTFLPIAAAFAFFDAVQVAANQLLRGLKDVTAAMWITGVSYWVIGFPVAYYLGLHTEIGAKGVWYGLMVALICAALGLGIRLRQQLALPTAVQTPR
ncbi:MATE family efflux transporter [Litorimonas sp. RW-G-Af-16]|uniref:MATE family efflux transporter n=1 Tax=Litorimonas sp. RW-G-Af-16 TaxID=3241168 RepID=UPI00390CAAA0